ncbi:uncharacterized protein V6R79_013605 [Siganus canaliculatus]
MKTMKMMSDTFIRGRQTVSLSFVVRQFLIRALSLVSGAKMAAADSEACADPSTSPASDDLFTVCRR